MDAMNEKWYKDNIEEPLRDIVRLLRNNGVNTECSCGHELSIQYQYIAEGTTKIIHDLVYSYLFEHGLSLNYTITISVSIKNGFVYSTGDIKFNKWGK